MGVCITLFLGPRLIILYIFLSNDDIELHFDIKLKVHSIGIQTGLKGYRLLKEFYLFERIETHKSYKMAFRFFYI